jgi:hypothetical protein
MALQTGLHPAAIKDSVTSKPFRTLPALAHGHRSTGRLHHRRPPHARRRPGPQHHRALHPGGHSARGGPRVERGEEVVSLRSAVLAAACSCDLLEFATKGTKDGLYSEAPRPGSKRTARRSGGEAARFDRVEDAADAMGRVRTRVAREDRGGSRRSTSAAPSLAITPYNNCPCLPGTFRGGRLVSDDVEHLMRQVRRGLYTGCYRAFICSSRRSGRR